MSCHAFSLDPRTVLGVGPGASAVEIREAYHAKSKKHHPDAGGDEWAFRMVARAYEVLKTTASPQSSQQWEQRAAGGQAPDQESRGAGLEVHPSAGATPRHLAGRAPMRRR